MEVTVSNNQLQLMVGDITEQKTDVIVNAANGTLLGGGGVDGAIHRAAGPTLLEACKKVRKHVLSEEELPTGEAVLTKGYDLPASFVIHTVGPVWQNKGYEADLLANCYENSLNLALTIFDHQEEVFKEQGGVLGNPLEMKEGRTDPQEQISISFPSIATGVYRFPIEQAAEVALSAVLDFLKKQTFGKVVFILFSEADYEIYCETLKKLYE